MLTILSPAKNLDFDTPPHLKTSTQPQFVEQSVELMAALRQYDVPALAQLMHLSDQLATLNVARNADWQPVFDLTASKHAALAFNGDVYVGLNASTLSAKELSWAQKHVRILSGLYGVLRPLDLIRPYRLEMGTALPTTKGNNLYAFWGASLAEHLNQELHAQRTKHLIHLASEEYFKVLPLKHLAYPVTQVVFQDGQNGAYKVISFFAKRARGAMARWMVKNKVDQPDDLKEFAEDGYVFSKAAVGKNGVCQWVFTREVQST